ncbi:tRNA 4-thiouridine(8) synthase ThiI [Candidatus Bathyarchaeota archaeon]|nr:tRNA 4-thiouridine(8) synthase ThiI [Candidatus Bathyarchaeota archaeon]
MPILVAYNEIALKSRYVRSSLERKLVSQISFSLKREGYTNFNVTRSFGRIIINSIPDTAVDVVSRVFGVVFSIPAEATDTTIESVISKAVEIADRELSDNNTFAVRPKVVGEHPYNSRDLAVKIGSEILEKCKNKNPKVNLTKPEVTIFIEVRNSSAYIYTKTVPGVSGLPYGSQGVAISLFSGGIDSPVASWFMMKRGVAIYPLFMDQTPYVGESYISRAVDAFEKIKKYAPTDHFHLHIAPMGEIMEIISETREPRFNCILCKRSMYRIAEEFSKQNNAKGIVTGESLGQVASQTLDNLNVLNAAVKIPVFRPLIGLDKVEIEEYARQINTYNITAKKIEGCKITPSSAATTSKLEKIEALEEELDLKTLCIKAANLIHI